MKVAVSFLLVVALAFFAVLPSYAEPGQVTQGTEIHLTLLTPISTSNSHEGDPFTAVLAQPVSLDSRIIIPAGTRIHGVVGTIQKPKNFSMFRGEAYMSLAFKSIEIDSRLIPVQMSLVAIGKPRVESYSEPRRDVKITEGEVVTEKHDYKADAYRILLGGGAGSLTGAIVGNIPRGFGIGLGIGAAYVVAKKGKDVDIPAQTGILTRLDSTITVPYVSAANAMPPAPAPAQ